MQQQRTQSQGTESAQPLEAVAVNLKGRKAKEKKPKIKLKTPMDFLKMEIAAELGLAEQVLTEGWGGLSTAQSGRIGGLMTKRIRETDGAILNQVKQNWSL
ncbi:MAG: small, acid-soluble spore protein, alpha/beta type [Symbiobacteriia bacterium]